MSIGQRVSDRTRRIAPGPAVKTLGALPFYLIGWLIGAVWFVLAWCWSALVVGFGDGARTRKDHGS